MMQTAIGIVPGTVLGEALAARLAADGKELVVERADGDLRALARRARLVVVDATAAALPEAARALGNVLDGNHLVAHTVRGLVGGRRAAEVIAEESAVRRVGVLGGPLDVEDLRAGRPSAGVIASRHPEVVDEMAAALSTPKLRFYRSREPIAVELAHSASDLIALGCGVADAMALGASARTLLVVRAVRELGRLVAALGGDPMAAAGLGGLGDLLAAADDREHPIRRRAAELAAGGDGAALPADVRESAAGLVALAREHRVPARVLSGLAELAAGRVSAALLVEALMTMPVLDD
jgi:glycerol-3-phosphate dehydrogenase